MLGWTVLALVFLDELLMLPALVVWGVHASGIAIAIAAPVAWVVVWFLFAAPRARLGGRVTTPVVKVVALGLPCLALWAAGHPSLAVALLVFSAAVNGLATLPQIRALGAQPGQRSSVVLPSPAPHGHTMAAARARSGDTLRYGCYVSLP